MSLLQWSFRFNVIGHSALVPIMMITRRSPTSECNRLMIPQSNQELLTGEKQMRRKKMKNLLYLHRNLQLTINLKKRRKRRR